MLSLLEIPYDIQTNIKEVAPNLYQVKSKTKEDIVYTVNMTIGRCECFAGKTALHAGINIVFVVKGLHHCSMSSQILRLFSEKDLPRLQLGKV